jgi:hypothetical protein
VKLDLLKRIVSRPTNSPLSRWGARALLIGSAF